MASRTWRSFDYLLWLALMALSALGVVMIYSATLNTQGLDNPVQRQLVYLGIGTVLLLLTASVDYRLLEIVQHPVRILTPLVISMLLTGAMVALHSDELTGQAIGAALLAPVLGPAVVGALAVFGVYLIDQTVVARLDLPMPRVLALVGVVGFAAVAALFWLRAGPALGAAYRPYGLAVAGGVVYLLDCLSLRYCDSLRNLLYVAALGVLGITLLVGQVAGGAQSWLGQGTVQPSELAKILIIIVLAHLLAQSESGIGRLPIVIRSILVAGVPMMLIYLQPDLGTAITLLPVWAAMVWTAGLRLQHLLLMLGAGAAALPLVWFGLEDYMRDRLLLFLNPAGDPDAYFNVHQALVSIGSGGWLGKGLTHGTQSQLHFLRVRHTDFIFAVTAEELGFLGAVVMMGLILLVVLRMVRIAKQSRDLFGRLLATGAATVVAFQSLVNIGMNLGMLPVTGLPLPFVSYGGSSLVTLMVGMGLVQSVAMRHKKLEFD